MEESKYALAIQYARAIHFALPLSFPQHHSLPFAIETMLRVLFPDATCRSVLHLRPRNTREYNKYVNDGSCDVPKFPRSQPAKIQEHHEFTVLTPCIEHQWLVVGGTDVTVKRQDPPPNQSKFAIDHVNWAVSGVGRHTSG